MQAQENDFFYNILSVIRSIPAKQPFWWKMRPGMGVELKTK